MTLKITSAKRAEVELLAELMQGYMKEFSAFETVEQDENGRFVYPYLPHYWEDPNRYPFLFRVDGEIAGFALTRFDVDPVNGREHMDMAEFYVTDEYRRSGVGTEAARHLWELFPGHWVVRVLKSNKNAQPFWRRVIEAYTGGNYTVQQPESAFGGAITYTFQTATDFELPDDIQSDPLDF